MPKILCIYSLAISGILFLLFFIDMLSGFPFDKAGGMMMNISFLVCTLIVGVFSFLTLRELR